ncbi:hypothetical protein E2562_003075 [Oryza meyeriana var. granulata]|uniref:Uncharacterized protein n=1 Tax=Oryza meyeriana var. granulata TaxID=110450 RepID=A0A6G1E9L3_9ORYZ|nr:hypothetical protein E2562_003075 [Oryza meyeriana var. granulata]
MTISYLRLTQVPLYPQSRHHPSGYKDGSGRALHLLPPPLRQALCKVLASTVPPPRFVPSMAGSSNGEASGHWGATLIGGRMVDEVCGGDGRVRAWEATTVSTMAVGATVTPRSKPSMARSGVGEAGGQRGQRDGSGGDGRGDRSR